MKQVIVLLLAFLVVLPASANPPNILHYQGKLVSVDDNSPVSEEVPMTFRLYSQEDSEEPLWEEEHTGDHAITIAAGSFSVELGSIQPIDPALFDGPTLFLGITIDGEELLPRQPVGGSSYALLASKSLDAETVGDYLPSDFESAGAVEAHENETPHLSTEQFEGLTEGGDTDLHSHPGISNEVNWDLLSSVFTSSYASDEEARSIPDANLYGTEMEVSISEQGIIRDITVYVDISHPSVSDLVVMLTSPRGTEILLHNQGEQETADLVLNYDEDREPAEGSLDDLNGEEINGIWNLSVVDRELENAGILNAFGLNIEYFSSNTLQIDGYLSLTSDGEGQGVISAGENGGLVISGGTGSSISVGGGEESTVEVDGQLIIGESSDRDHGVLELNDDGSLSVRTGIGGHITIGNSVEQFRNDWEYNTEPSHGSDTASSVAIDRNAIYVAGHRNIDS